ncbi:MAG: polyprenyl synthetase family protein [Muribaculaceae bacterium]|nr:polyprenyl synthetase family protein [Muribaculaceae bacterium]
MMTTSEYTSEVEKVIKDLALGGRAPQALYQPIEYALSAGGKRLRPVLTLMACQAFGGGYMPALKAAAGIEMFHNFTLLHDDVMDKSDTRRGRASVYSRFGTDTAILSGDTMLTLATQLISEVPDAQLRRVLDVFNSMAIEVYEGQQLDLSFEHRADITLEEYIRMIGQKTGALFGASLKIGAIIGGASERDANYMYDFGMMLGLAFQIQDDWLDTFGEASTFGKPIGGDIANGKKTYLYVMAMNRGGNDTQLFATAMAMEQPELRVKTVTRLMEKMGISEECRKAVASYSSKALSALKRTTLGDEAKDALRKVAEKLIGRKK